MKKILFVIASEMFRDLEYIVPNAILKQNNFEVKTISTTKISKGRFGFEVENDFVLGEKINLDEFVGIVFIGGLGSLDYIGNEEMKNITLDFNNKGKLVSAICAAPRVLLSYHVLDNKNVIGNDWDNNFGNMCSEVGAIYKGKEKGVELDGNIITAYGPEVVEQFANEIVKYFS